MQNSQLIATKSVDVYHHHAFEESLYFYFKGKLTLRDGHEATVVWSRVFAKSKQKLNLIWDCTEMEGFERAARTEWTKALQNEADRINKIFLVSDSILIRGAARLMLKLFHIELIAVKSMSELSVIYETEKELSAVV